MTFKMLLYNDSGAINGTGTAYPFGTPEFTPVAILDHGCLMLLHIMTVVPLVEQELFTLSEHLSSSPS
jgi:hypothetical protein